MLLRSGDVLVLSGEARRCYHGLPRVLDDQDLPEDVAAAAQRQQETFVPAAMDGPGGWRRPSRSVMTKIMKESVKTGHPTGLPEKLLRLFAPNPPLRHFSSNCKPKKKPRVTMSGIGQFVDQFAVPGDTEYEPPLPSAEQFPEPRLVRNSEYSLQVRLYEETKPEKLRRLQEWRSEKAKRDIEEKLHSYDPNNDPMIEGDPYKTLFLSRLSYEVTERKLRHEFEEYGPIKRIRLVHDRNTDKPRGYAFIEYEHKKDMKEAYKQSDGRKVEGRRILVDVERGRTVENWRPMRLGGGLGGDSRLPKEPRKKLLAEAAAKGLPPPADERAAARYSDRSSSGVRQERGKGYEEGQLNHNRCATAAFSLYVAAVDASVPPAAPGDKGFWGQGMASQREEPVMRGPPREFDRGPPPGDFRGREGRDMRGPPPGGDRFMDRGPPRGYDSRGGGGGGGGREREYGRERERDGRDRERDGRDRERDGRDRYGGDRDKRPREASPSREFKRGRHDDDRRRYDRDF
eukprot:gene7227-7440_t